MSRRVKSFGFNNPNFVGYLHREHRSKKNRKHISYYSGIKLYKGKLKKLKEQDLWQVEL